MTKQQIDLLKQSVAIIRQAQMEETNVKAYVKFDELMYAIEEVIDEAEKA